MLEPKFILLTMGGMYLISMLAVALAIGMGVYAVDSPKRRKRQGLWFLEVLFISSVVSACFFLSQKELDAFTGLQACFLPYLFSFIVIKLYNIRGPIVRVISHTVGSPTVEVKEDKFLSIFSKYYYLDYKPYSIRFENIRSQQELFLGFSFTFQFTQESIMELYRQIPYDIIREKGENKKELSYGSFWALKICDIFRPIVNDHREDLSHTTLSRDICTEILKTIEEKFKFEFNQQHKIKLDIKSLALKRILRDLSMEVEIKNESKSAGLTKTELQTT